MRIIYLDYNATTPIDPAVLAEMLPFLREEYGNPSSNYSLGRRARDAIEQARTDVAALLGAMPDEIVFTSGGTESSNIAIRGAVTTNSDRRTIVTSTIEHPATEECCNLLARAGHRILRVRADPDGRIDPQRVIDALERDTVLVTIIHAQNEIGTLQPLREISRAARAAGAVVHTDAAQSLGKIPVDVNDLGVDLLSVAGHKLYAPKGIGALYVRRGLELPPLLAGAGQERGRRAGTENVASIVGLGAACRIAARLLPDSVEPMREKAEALLTYLQREVPGLKLVGDPDERLPNTLNVLFPETSGRLVLEACPRVMASTGSACHADREEPSKVLLELGIDDRTALGAVRLSLGRATTMDDVATAATSLAAAWRVVTGRATASAEATHAG